jgi:hypothetical protein
VVGSWDCGCQKFISAKTAFEKSAANGSTTTGAANDIKMRISKLLVHPQLFFVSIALAFAMRNWFFLSGAVSEEVGHSRRMMLAEPNSLSAAPPPLLLNESWDATAPINASSTPLPLPVLRVWDNYKRWHSHQSLIQQPENRQFVIGYYSCPLQAGNRLHDFWNSMIVAIVTNRTLLWKYSDEETCLIANKGYDPKVCEHGYSEKDCDKTLERASWIPSFDEWAPKLGLNTTLGPRNPDCHLGGMTGVEWWPTKEMKKALNKHRRTRHNTEEHERHPSRHLWLSGPLIQTSREWFLDEQVPKYGMKRILIDGMRNSSTTSAKSIQAGQQIFEGLYSDGIDFLYGMLYRDTFTYIGDKSLQDTPEDRALSHGGITISLHSRHTQSSDGKVSREERQCMNQVMFETRGRRGPDVPCTIFLMSDRQQALDDLSQLAIEKYNCTPVVAPHEAGSGLTREHGPFSGNGFFQDLYYGSKARDGYIGHCGRSSSQMLQDAIAYDRFMEALSETDTRPPIPLSFCCLPLQYRKNWQLLAGK